MQMCVLLSIYYMYSMLNVTLVCGYLFNKNVQMCRREAVRGGDSVSVYLCDAEHESENTK